MKKYLSILIIGLMLSLCFSVNTVSGDSINVLNENLEQSLEEPKLQIYLNMSKCIIMKRQFLGIYGVCTYKKLTATLKNSGTVTATNVSVSLNITYIRLSWILWAGPLGYILPKLGFDTNAVWNFIENITDKRTDHIFIEHTKTINNLSLNPGESKSFEFNNSIVSGMLDAKAYAYIDGVLKSHFYVYAFKFGPKKILADYDYYYWN